MENMMNSRIAVAVVAGPLVLYAMYYFILSKKSAAFLAKKIRMDFDVTDFGTSKREYLAVTLQNN